MKGQVVKVCSDAYFVLSENEKISQKCSARGLLKHKKAELFVGDFVEYENGVIKSVYERKNTFVRPSVVNIDIVAIVVSFEPEPDYLLIDKLILNAEKSGVDKILVVNKTDADGELFSSIKKEYASAVSAVFAVSAKNGSGISELLKYLDGKLTVLAGQSAVGKTSLINEIFGARFKTGELSEKSARGRHTTTFSAIHIADNLKIIDSPGFAVINAFIEKDELKDYYPEFIGFADKCRFRGCLHLSEPNCAVKNAVDDGIISEKRYSRYVEIYNEISTKGKNYGKY